nr:MAG TPA: hypothetical protein [Siphoviridae sp. ctZCl11]
MNRRIKMNTFIRFMSIYILTYLAVSYIMCK